MIRSHLQSLLASTALWATPDDNKGPLGHQTTDSVDTTGGSGFSGSISMDVGGDDVTVSDVESTTDHVEVGNGAEPGDGEQASDEGDGDAGEEANDEAEGGDDDAPIDVDVPDEFKADDPEVVAQFDKAFKDENGKLNLVALSTQWWANAQASEDGKGHLTPATYDYLDSLGIPPELVKQVEANQQAANATAAQNLYARAGGKANLDAAIAWAVKDGSYNETQKAAFNRAIAAGGNTAEDAIDLLMSRHEKATKRNSTSPRKSAGEQASAGEASGAEADVFSTREEWLAARKEAGRDTTKQQAVSAKFRRSPNAGKW